MHVTTVYGTSVKLLAFQIGLERMSLVVEDSKRWKLGHIRMAVFFELYVNLSPFESIK
jgi:hypothetical protein